MTFVFLIMIFGQVISFLNSELMGFLFVTFYFGIFPITAAIILIINFILILTQKAQNKLATFSFGGALVAYLLILWRFPLAGSLAFFMSDYSKIAILNRCIILIFTISTWCVLKKYLTNNSLANLKLRS